MVIVELVILARLVYRKRAEIQAGIENSCEHSLACTDEKEDTSEATNDTL